MKYVFFGFLLLGFSVFTALGVTWVLWRRQGKAIHKPEVQT